MAFAPLAGLAGEGLGLGTILQGVGALASLVGAFSKSTPPVPKYENVPVPTPEELGTNLSQQDALARQEAEAARNRRRLMAAQLDSKVAVSTSSTRFAANDLATPSVTKATLLGA